MLESQKYFVERIIIRDHDITEEDTVLISNTLTHIPTVTELDISHCRLTKTEELFGTLLLKNTSLKSLRLSACQLNNYVEKIFIVLLSNTTLTALDISANNIPATSFDMLFEGMLSGQIKLRALNLSHNNSLIESDTFTKLVLILSNNFPLTHLSLNYCDLDGDEIEAIGKALKTNSHLKGLEIQTVPYPTSANYKMNFALSEIVKNPTLETLSVTLSLENLGGDDKRSNNNNIWKTPPSYEEFSFLPFEEFDWGVREFSPPLSFYSNKSFQESFSTACNKQLLFLSAIHPQRFLVCKNKKPVRHPFFSELYRNYTLRHLTLQIPYVSTTTLLTLKENLKAVHAFTTFDTNEKTSDKSFANHIRRLNLYSRKKFLHQRNNFIYILLLLEFVPGWKKLPRDVKLLILQRIKLEETYPMGKSRIQILKCAEFIFSHAQEYYSLIKLKQKTIIVEKMEPSGKYSIGFFKPSSEKMPVTLVAYPNEPLALYGKKFPSH